MRRRLPIAAASLLFLAQAAAAHICMDGHGRRIACPDPMDALIKQYDDKADGSFAFGPYYRAIADQLRAMKQAHYRPDPNDPTKFLDADGRPVPVALPVDPTGTQTDDDKTGATPPAEKKNDATETTPETPTRTPSDQPPSDQAPPGPTTTGGDLASAPSSPVPPPTPVQAQAAQKFLAWGQQNGVAPAPRKQETKAAEADASGAGATSTAGNSAKTGSLGSQLKSAFADSKSFEGGMAGGLGGAMGELGAGKKAGSASFAGAGATRGPSDSGQSDLARAAGPYAHVFQQQGLKLGVGADGRPSIVDRWGKPASTADQARLAAAIRAEPSALERHPDYFDPARGGIARGDFYELKGIYKKGEALRGADFKDIALTPAGEERDFTRSKSCEIVSGDCNKHAKESYKKDDDVPASDLASIIASIRSDLGSQAQSGPGSGSRVGGAAAKLRGFLSRLFGGGGARDAVRGPRAAGRSAESTGPEDSRAAAPRDGNGAANAAASSTGRDGTRAGSGSGGIDRGTAAAVSLGALGAALVGGGIVVFMRRGPWRESS